MIKLVVTDGSCSDSSELMVNVFANPTPNLGLDIEGLLLTMFDSRLRLSNQVVDEVRKHFSTMVFETIIRRNTRLGEAPSYGESIIAYDATSKGAINYLNLAQELIKKNS